MSHFEIASTGTNTNPFPSHPTPFPPSSSSSSTSSSSSHTMQSHYTNQRQQQQYGDDTTTNYTTAGYSEGGDEEMKLYQQYGDNSQQRQGGHGLHHIDGDPDIHGKNPSAVAEHTLSFTEQQHNKKRMMAAATMIDMAEYPEDRNDDGHHPHLHHQQQHQQQAQYNNRPSPALILSSGVRGTIGQRQQPQQQQLYRQPHRRPGSVQQQQLPPKQRPQNILAQRQQQQQQHRPKQQQQQQQHAPNHYGYDLQQQQQQQQQHQRNQRYSSPLQHEHHLHHQQQPQHEPNRPIINNNNNNRGPRCQPHQPRPPKLIHVAPPQSKERQQPTATTSSPSPPPRQESLENATPAAATATVTPETGSEDRNVTPQSLEHVLLDDQAHYKSMMMMPSADSAVSLTGENEIKNNSSDIDVNSDNIDNGSVVRTESPSSQSLCSRPNSFSTSANHSGGLERSAVGMPRQSVTGIGRVEEEEWPLAQPNPPVCLQKPTAAAGGVGGTKIRSASVSSGHTHVVRGSERQARMHGNSSGGGGSVIVDMGVPMSQPPPPVPSSPGKTGWEREDATPTTPVSAYQFPAASKNGSDTDNGQDSPSATGAGATGVGHQHSNSLFDFFRGRKSSLHRNSNLHQQVAATAAAAYTISGSRPSGSESFSGTDSYLPSLPLMGTPPLIARSRLGSVAALGPPVPMPLRKQSLDVSMLSGYHYNVPGAAGGGGLPMFDRHATAMSILPSSTSSPAFCGVSGAFGARTGTGIGTMTPTQALDAITSSTIPSTSTVTANTNTNTNTNASHSSSSSAQSTLSRVAAAVVGATVGKRRPSVASEFEAGASGIFGLSRYREKPPLVPVVAKQQQHQHQEHQHQHQNNEGVGGNGGAGTGLDAEQLQNHAQFMRSEKSMAELKEYVDSMYHTAMNKDVALEYCRTQISVLHKELDQNRSRSEDDRKTLIAEVDTVKEQVVSMEVNFLLWRTKIHNDQMTQQEEFLQERLVKQDRVEELEDALHASQEEVTRLRNRLLVLEYEDGYVGPTAFIPSPTSTSFQLPSTSDFYNDPSNPCAAIAIEHGPMTVNTHKRRSGDFRIMEQRAQTFEGQVQELKQAMEKLKQDHFKDLTDLRMKLGVKCSKLEHDVHAAKMESTMYNEMMHEVVTENDDLRKQIKDIERKLRRQGQIHSTDSGISTNSINSSSSASANSTKNKSSNGSRPRRNPDYYGFPDDGSYSLDGSDDDDMEDIVI